MRRVRLVLAALVACALISIGAIPTRADIPVNAVTGTLTAAGNCVTATNLVGQSSASFVETGTVGPTDARGSVDGVNYTALTIFDTGGSSHTQPFTPTSGTSYYVAVTSLKAVQVCADATWSGQSASVTVRASASALSLANNVTVTGTSNVNVHDAAGNNINSVSNALDVNCALGCAGTTLRTPVPYPAGTVQPTAVPYDQVFNACLYSTATPAPTSGNYYPCQVDAAGNQKISVQNTPNVVIAAATPLPVSTPSACTAASCSVVLGGISPTPVPATPQPEPAHTALPVMSYPFGVASGGYMPFVFCDQFVDISDTASGNTLLVAAAAGKAIYVCGLSFQAAGAVNVGFEQGTQTTSPCDTANTTLAGPFPQNTNSGAVLPNSPIPYFHTQVGDQLCLNLSVAIGVYGVLTYAQM